MAKQTQPPSGRIGNLFGGYIASIRLTSKWRSKHRHHMVQLEIGLEIHSGLNSALQLSGTEAMYPADRSNSDGGGVASLTIFEENFYGRTWYRAVFNHEPVSPRIPAAVTTGTRLATSFWSEW